MTTLNNAAPSLYGASAAEIGPREYSTSTAIEMPTKMRRGRRVQRASAAKTTAAATTPTALPVTTSGTPIISGPKRRKMNHTAAFAAAEATATRPAVLRSDANERLAEGVDTGMGKAMRYPSESRGGVINSLSRLGIDHRAWCKRGARL